ncbi:TPA: helix-turn-helix transcriptional regulator [Pseudomonas aeruginosa]|uniref:helix-turn-helix transcriptional regulator n=1 Tax=Pseudomonas aeruginosa TaxID=287 RepID=UPI00053CFB77|nr:AlpA family transcriptional regulator [Pseudomonas aeruginosa]MBV5895000.1 AlpA family transcriptional regulator [Pseudomonas aeruginosa]HCF5694177.1 AlpA family transcriptional regulator [Pseudomonas aeruginosa]HEJ1612708.1 AlpA family transcriptional regulator [Pseudomonas aeruginosa]HEJ4888228.1 AlpA family transcriptional regulator [Pseudomonas aeruginosa]HEJ5515331.1 AlpA family transcriptional regulator [Pseudomonas aeruginosa]
MKILRLDSVIESTGLARSTIYKLVGSGDFPKPVPLVGRHVGWVESEVQEWIKARIAQRNLMDSPIT